MSVKRQITNRSSGPFKKKDSPTCRIPHILKADPMHVPKSLFHRAEETPLAWGSPDRGVNQECSVSSEALDIHIRLVGMAQSLQAPCALPERQLKVKPDAQATDYSPLSVTVSTSEHFLC